MKNPLVREFVSLVEMIENGRDDSAGSTGRSRNYLTAGCILLADSKCVCIDKPSCLKRFLITGSLDIIGWRLPGEIERARQHTLVVDSPLHGSLHRLPGLIEIIPDISALAFSYILPIASSLVLAPAQNVREFVKIINRFGLESVTLEAF